MPFKKKDVVVAADLGDLTPEQKKALALKLLGEVDPKAAAVVNMHDEETEEDKQIEKEFASEAAKQRAEPHFWIELNILGPDDKNLTPFFNPAGVEYTIHKGARVPVPQSLINCIEMAVFDSWQKIIDQTTGNPRLVRVKQKRFPYSNFGPATPEEVTRHREDMQRLRKAQDEQGRLGQDAVKAAILTDGEKHEEEPFVPAYMKQEITEVP